MKRLPLGLKIVLGFCVFFLAVSVNANSCRDRREGYRYLPLRLGLSGSTQKTPYVLRCDTMEVSAGRVTEVEAGTMLYFSRPQSGNVIRVSGTLRLKGNKDTWVYLSGSLDTVKGKNEPGKSTWGGIVVEAGGKLIMDYAGIWGAPIPVTASSDSVIIHNSFFTGSSGLIRPDGSVYDLDPTFAAVNDLDFSRKETLPIPRRNMNPTAENSEDKPQGMTAAEKADLLSKSAKTPFWTKGKVWGVTGVAAAVAAGAAWYYYPRQNSEPSAKVLRTPTFENPPSFPGN